MMLNIFRPDSGTINMMGGPMDEAKKSRIGYLPEERGLYRELRCWSVSPIWLSSRAWRSGRPRRSVRRYLDQLDLAEHAPRRSRN